MRAARSARSNRLARSAPPRADDDDDDDAADMSELVEQRLHHVYFYAPVTRKSAMRLYEKLDAASQHAVGTGQMLSVHLHIHSDGGDAYTGLACMDRIASNPVKIVGIAEGFVASAATFLLLGCHERYGMPHVTLLIHQLSTGMWGKYDECKHELENDTALMGVFRDVYRSKTSLTENQLTTLLSREKHMSVAECVEASIFKVWESNPVLALDAATPCKRTRR